MKKKLLIILILVSLAIPHLKPARATVPVTDPAAEMGIWEHLAKDIAQYAKQWAKDMEKNWQKYLAKVLMREIASYIRQSILHPRGGMSGPAMVTNWRDYNRNNQDVGATIARQIIGDAIWGPNGDTTQSVVCSSFRDALGQTVGARRATSDFSKIAHLFRIDSDQTYREMARCTLPSTIMVNGISQPFDIKKFASGEQFSLDTFLNIMANPYVNTLDGATYQAQRLIERQIAQQQKRATTDATVGGGFTSITNKNGDITSPGSLISNTAANIVKNGMDCLNNIDTAAQAMACGAAVVEKAFENFANLGEGGVDTGANGESAPTTAPNPFPDQAECDRLCVDSTNASKLMCLNPLGEANPNCNKVNGQCSSDELDQGCMDKLYNDCLQSIDSCRAPANPDVNQNEGP